MIGDYTPIDRSQFPKSKRFDFIRDRILQDDEKKYPVLDSVEDLQYCCSPEYMEEQFNMDIDEFGNVSFLDNLPVFHFNTGLHLMESEQGYDDTWEMFKDFSGVRR